MNDSSNKFSCNIGCISLPSALITIALIAIRAFQTNAEPMSNWSYMSWFLMFLPVIIPFAIWFIVIAAALIGTIICALKKW